MPTYEYQCENCGYKFDAKQSFKDEPLTVCPNCGGHIHRVIHAAGVVFKGSGWYITDSKGASSVSTTAEKKSESAAATTESSTSTAPASESTTPATPKPEPAKTTASEAKPA